MELQYKGLRILSRYCSCQDSEFRSALETSSVDMDKLLGKNRLYSNLHKTAQASRSNKKEMCKIFKPNSLQITIEANKKVVDFLDITLDLRTEIYKPYKKPNSNLTYIRKQSNHSPSIIKNLPKSINKRLSTNSKIAQIFNEACPTDTEALKKNGYNTNLQFDKTCSNNSNEKNKTRKRNIT